MFTFKVMRTALQGFGENWTVFQGAAYDVVECGEARVLKVLDEPPFTPGETNPNVVGIVQYTIPVSGPVYVMNDAGRTVDTIQPVLPTAAA